MDAEEFMMHGFDSDVCEDDDEPEETNISPGMVPHDVSQQHTK